MLLRQKQFQHCEVEMNVWQSIVKFSQVLYIYFVVMCTNDRNRRAECGCDGIFTNDDDGDADDDDDDVSLVILSRIYI